jgi:hypothetical protein
LCDVADRVSHRHTTSELLAVNTDRVDYLGENLKVFQGLDVLNRGELQQMPAMRYV